MRGVVFKFLSRGIERVSTSALLFLPVRSCASGPCTRFVRRVHKGLYGIYVNKLNVVVIGNT